MTELMKRLFQYYLDNQDEFVEKYNGKVILLHDFQVVDAFDTEWDAYVFGTKELEPGTFIIQLVTPGPDAYTVSIASNFVFSGV